MSNYIKAIANKRKREISPTEVEINSRGSISKIARSNLNQYGICLDLTFLLYLKTRNCLECLAATEGHLDLLESLEVCRFFPNDVDERKLILQNPKVAEAVKSSLFQVSCNVD
jgi:hypothetical protein